MTRVALLWHMHQPYYEDLVTGEHMLPWVRLHALRDYYGMVALTKEFPDLRLTINLVPSLLVQIEAFASNRARDRVLDVGLKPADQLTGSDVIFMLRHFFHAHRENMIGAHPRYAELFARRGDPPQSDAAAGEIAARFSVNELRDLQVWQKLAWLDPFYLQGDSRVRQLLAKGRDFSEDDKQTLRQVELELLGAVIPACRDAAASGRVELSTSPFYHPILPLLCDTEIYRRTHPDAPRLRRPFAHPEDALAQLRDAVACHERLFGQPPVGLWPSEGAVSPAMVPLVAQAGFKWMATDEMLLARTLNATFSREGGQVVHPERLYRPYVVTVDDARVACAFRDHTLSDLIGFVYAGWNADAAANDFAERLAAAGRRFSDRTGGEDAFIPIILDGENAWEHYAGGGRPFLRALYSRLTSHPELRTVTMAEGCGTARDLLPGIFPGSWIDADFYIWIGHADDRKAWSQLADARALLDATHDVPADAMAQARQEVLIAEGSDWYWWYGDDHSSEHDLEFDDLFRRHLRNVYRLLDRTPPDELRATNISTGRVAAPILEPTSRIRPTLDGEVTSYFEWLGAGWYEVRETAGAMHQIDRSPLVVRTILFGFDAGFVYIRLDTVGPASALLGEGFTVGVRFLEPDGWAVRVAGMGENVAALVAGPDGQSVGGQGQAAAGRILEVAVPRSALGTPRPGLAPLQFFVTIERGGEQIERHPPHQSITLALSEPELDALYWRV